MYLRQRRNVFSYMLLIALIPDIATELYMALGSTGLHDSAFNVAHSLKALSYMIPVAGLSIDYVHTYAKVWSASSTSLPRSSSSISACPRWMDSLSWDI